ncbi:MAG TPA: hypothetical protein VHZ81_06135 [Galbitalea sp.]|nr:hypothetical protein [Galbitalea sp.]
MPSIVAEFTVDPNWLLSSTAQSAAALVAIVGGFLVSRLIALSAERAAVGQRREELTQRRSLKRNELDEVRAVRLQVSREWFLEHHLNDVVDAKGEIDPESLIEEFTPLGSSEDEMRAFAAELLEATGQAFSALSSQFISRNNFPSTVVELRSAGIEVPPEFETLFARVARAVRESLPRPFGYSSMIDMSTLIIPNSTQAPVRRQEARIDRERQLESDIRLLDAEIDLIETRTRSFAKPDGVTGAVLSLVYLSLVGIVLPTTLMAVRPVPDSVGWRVTVVAAFVSGLVVLLVYFVRRARSLR